MWFLLALCACPADPPRWADLHTDLDPFRERLTVPTALRGGTALTPVAGLPGLVATGPDGVVFFDARYRVASTFACLDPGPFPAFDDGLDRHGRCPAGKIELDRSHLGGVSGVLSVADDPAGSRLSVLTAAGVRVAETDLLVGSPWDWLRLGEPLPLVDEGGLPAELIVAVEGGWWGTTASTLTRWNTDGAVLEAMPIEAQGRLLVTSAEHVWAATGATVIRDDGVTASVHDPGGLTGDGEGGVWATRLEDGTVLHLRADGSAEATVSVDGLRGPIAIDTRTEKVYAVTETGVAIVSAAGKVTAVELAGAVAIAVNASSEITVLDDQGTVHVFLDETALGDAPALAVWVASFFENPRQASESVECSGADDAMEERVERAAANREMFRDLVSPVALAISPAAAMHSRRCVVSGGLTALIDGDRLEPGVLFHDPPDCSTQSCLDDATASDLGELGAIGVSPTWVAGAAGWETGTGDWVKTLVALDMPAVHGFVGLSALPDITMDDPRAKDALPWAGETESGAWHASSASTAGTDAGSGGLLLLPGNTQAAFSLADCPGLTQVECRLVNAGGLASFTEEDLAVADVLLHRAAVHRSAAGGDTFYVHLPAIETYDYTAGCTRSDEGAWTGGDCQAALWQAWTDDIQARLVTAGVVNWSLPGEF